MSNEFFPATPPPSQSSARGAQSSHAAPDPATPPPSQSSARGAQSSHAAPDYVQGRSPIWTAETIRDIQAKAELGRYQIRGFSSFKRFPTLDDLVFLPAVMTRLPLEGYREFCETKTVIGGQDPERVSRPLELDLPVYLTSMSFGALGTNAKMALGWGFSRAGSATCTGEGGMLPEEREASERLIYQMTPSRYGLDLEHLRMADAIEIVIGQGAKPGTGGLLLGMKVSEKVASMRTLPVGVDQRSAVRHPDFLGADDLQVKIQELREATDYRVPIVLKLAACRVDLDVKIAAKTGCDAIVVDGAEASTAASPEFQLDHCGIPTLAAIPAARRALEELGLYGKVTLIASGGIRNGVDAAKALALGADCVAIGTAALIALGCNAPRHVEGYHELGTAPGACHHCHTGRCPVGITTQDPELEARLDPEEGAQRVHNFLTSMAMEMTVIAKSCGKRNVHNLEPEDLRAVTLESSAFAGVPLAGVEWVVGPGLFDGKGA